MDNLQETSVDEINIDGGWLITHHTQTWDTRVRLDSIKDEVAQKQAALDEAQKAFDEVQAKVEAFQVQIEAAKMDMAMSVDATTSTPKR